MRAAILFALGITLGLTACSRNGPNSPKDAATPGSQSGVATRTEVQIPTGTVPEAPPPEPADAGVPTASDAAAQTPDSGVDPRAACKACSGEYRRHGLLPEESCNCRTRDHGKRCRDGRECEGQCLADRPQLEITSKGPPQLGFFVGTCSEFVTTFGCHRIIQNGA